MTEPDALPRPYNIKPMTLLMTGGPRNGETVRLPGHGQPPPQYLFRATSGPPLTVLEQIISSSPPFSQFEVDVYNYTGRIHDDGTRVYTYEERR